MGVIFDLDQTIVDSTVAELLRKQRSWPQVYLQIPKFTVYEGLNEVFKFLHDNKIEIALVSSSPKPYCIKVIDYIKINCKHIVAYHDASPIKPHAAPMLKALELLKMTASDVISIGDRAIDIASSRSAGIRSIGCLWGSNEKELLKASNPDYLINRPVEFIPIIKKEFNI